MRSSSYRKINITQELSSLFVEGCQISYNLSEVRCVKDVLPMFSLSHSCSSKMLLNLHSASVNDEQTEQFSTRPVECRSFEKASKQAYRYRIKHNLHAIFFKWHNSSPTEKPIPMDLQSTFLQRSKLCKQILLKLKCL